MGHATAAVNKNVQPIEGSISTYLDSTQKTYYNGTYMQNDAGTDEMVSATTSTVGIVLGVCSENFEYAAPYNHRIGRIDIEPNIRKDLSITGGTTSTMGYPVWATYDTTLTITYASGAKLIGFCWVLRGSVVLVDIGWLNRALIALGGSVWIDETVGSIAGADLSTAFRLRWTAPYPCVVTHVYIENMTATDVAADITFTLKKNNAGLDLATYQLDDASERAAGYQGDLAPSGGTVLAKGDTIDIYTATITSPASAGDFVFKITGYKIAN